MENIPLHKRLAWLTLGLLLVFISMIIYLVDYLRTDKDILYHVREAIQSDFIECINYFRQDKDQRSEPKSYFTACELEYDKTGKLISWTRNEYLPKEKEIRRLENLNQDRILRLGRNAYYQYRRQDTSGVHVVLIPLHIGYDIENRFLVPFTYLGRWTHESAWLTNQHKKFLRVTTMIGDQGIQIHDVDGLPTYSIDGIPIEPYRHTSRRWVVLLLILGAVSLCIYLRFYTLQHWQLRYIINGVLLLSVLALRYLLKLFDLPRDYINLQVFSPNILSFNEYFAPSLGELTINLLVVLIVSWILYIHFFRLLNIGYRKISNVKVLPWIALIVSIGISTFLLKIYFDIFSSITLNSRVDVEFSNIFKTNLYSFLILLDVGLLLLAISLIQFSILKFNVYFSGKFGYSSRIVLPQLFLALAFNIFWFKYDLKISLLATVALFMLCVVLYRRLFENILHQDLLNYLFIIFAFSIIVCYNVVQGIDLRKRDDARRLADTVLSSELDNIVSGYDFSLITLDRELEKIEQKRRELGKTSDLVEHIRGYFRATNFKGYDIRLFAYDTRGRRIGNSDIKPIYDLTSDISIDLWAEKIQFANTVEGPHTMYRISNTENRFADIYLGQFDLDLGRYGKINFVLELVPRQREVDGLYPFLSVDENVYEDTRLRNSFDLALYQDGSLYYHQGKSEFQIQYEPDTTQRETEGRKNPEQAIINKGKKYIQYVQTDKDEKTVVIRFPVTTNFGVITLFSFIFYFYILGTLGILVLPVWMLRSLRMRKINYYFPLRAKIRFGLLIISVLPMLGIIAFLYPFIEQRFTEQAKTELLDEAERLNRFIGREFINMENDKLRKYKLQKDLVQQIKELEYTTKNDVNLFDANGRRIASTQYDTWNEGLSSDLMDANAYNRLRGGTLVDIVVEERISNLTYYSGYRSILGNNNMPIGFINVPYVAKQDQLEDQVLDFLSYLANIYLLVFLLINAGAVIVSNAITQPLSMIQQRLSAIKLGSPNQKIDYDSQDEIGEIVRTYNQMVKQLAQSEKRLAKTERELAWRQMARQVAHEIKNPLTPMKLSIQHLTRAWKEQHHKLDNIFPRTMKTLLAQIDTMVRIANSFSEFAKMPDPTRIKMSLNEVLLEVIDLYAQSEEAVWLIDVPQDNFSVMADRDQIARCFQNLIKNALQAIEKDGMIQISMKIKSRMAIVAIRDNGKGMSEEVQARAFEPSFSTKSSGMGLGLAMVKRIVEISGGRIHFESEIGEGTTFFVELPAADIDETIQNEGFSVSG